MGNFLREIYKKEQIGFVAVYEAGPGPVDTSALDLTNYTNLVAVHASVSGTSAARQTHLFSYWRDQASHQLCGAQLEAKLGLATPLVAGPWGQPRMPVKRWWQFDSLKELLLAVSAVIGAWTVTEAALTRGWNWLAAAPQASVHISAAENILAGTDATFTLDWQNGSAAPLVVTGHSFALKNTKAGQIEVQTLKDTVLDLAGSETKQVTLRSRPAIAAAGEVGPVDFTLEGWVQAKAGLLRREAKFEPKHPPVVKVWRRLGCTPHPVLKREVAPGKIAEFEGTIYAGEALGNVRATVMLALPDSTVEVLHDKLPLPMEPVPGWGWRADLSLSNAQKFTAYPLRISVKGAHSRVTDWNEFALKMITITCQ